MNEDDTFVALRRTPFSEMVRKIRTRNRVGWAPGSTRMSFRMLLKENGWTTSSYRDEYSKKFLGK